MKAVPPIATIAIVPIARMIGTKFQSVIDISGALSQIIVIVSMIWLPIWSMMLGACVPFIAKALAISPPMLLTGPTIAVL
ncbi:hypothetical protein D9M71_584890 [compost metagenome]